MTTTQYINLSLQIFGCVLTAIIITCLGLSRNTNPKRRKTLTLFLLFNAGVMLFDAFALYFRGGETTGISFNDYAFDDDTKIYLGFTKEEDSQWYFGSMFSGTNLTVSVGILSALCGIALGVTGTVFFKKSKKRKEDPTPATA